MLDYKYVYFIGVILALIVWIIFFIIRKDTRKEMLILSLIFGIPGPLAAYVHLNDLWRPITLTGNPIGIEDFLFGFTMGGIAGVIYEVILNKKVKSKNKKSDIKLILIPVSLMFIIYFGFSLLLNLNTFISSISAFVISTIIIWIKRKDLIKDSLFSGLLFMLFAFIGYQILNVISPGFFEIFWQFKNIGKTILLNIPLEEYIWFFTFGCFFGPLYEYWKKGKLINKKD
jgi:hypothetical protein